MQFNNWKKVYPNQWKRAEDILKKGGVIVIPTDTIYGIVGSVFSKKAVERIYKVRGRDEKKPCIILVSSFEQLSKLGINISKEEKKSLIKFWPGKVSVVLPCTSTVLQKKLKYLHRGTKTLAVRMVGPRNPNIYKLIKQVGPIIAPSANPQGLPPAKTIWEAKNYFRTSVDMYMCGGTRKSKPSTLIELKNNKINVLRQGGVKIKNK